MGILPKAIAAATAASLTAAVAALGQSPQVLTGAAAYGDWRTDEPGVRRKITPADMPPPYLTANANRAPTVVARPRQWPGRKHPPALSSSSSPATSMIRGRSA
jgi:hypothetical protein